MKLEGEWKFYWQQLYQNDSLLDESSDYQKVYAPDIWNNYEVDGKSLSGFGYATYILTIVSDKDFPDLALELPDFYNSYNVYLNGTRIANNGLVGKTEETSLLEWQPQTVGISLKKGENIVAIEIANFDHIKGGFFSVVTLGTFDFLTKRRANRVMIDVFAIACYFIIGLFLLASYLFWNKDHVILYCSLFSICYSLRLGTHGLHLFTYVFDDLPWQVSMKIQYLTFFSSYSFFVLLLSSVFKRDLISLIKYSSVIINSIFIAVMLVVPLKIYSNFPTLFTISQLIIVVPCIFYMFKAVLKRRPGAFIAMISLALMIYGMLLHAAMHYGWVTDNPYIVNVVFLLAFVVMTVVLAQRFAMAFETVEKLKTEAQDKKDIQAKWFANISHELRTPLTLLNGQLEALQLSERLKRGDDKQRLNLARKNAIQLSKMIDDLLDLSKIEVNKKKLHLSEVEVSGFIRNLVSQFSDMAEARNIELSIENESNMMIYAHLDVLQFEKIINNLIYNALKFTPEQGVIKIKIGVEEKINIKVEDSGSGISKEELPYIFDRFYQADNQKTSGGGTGLGLAIVKEIVGLHDGDIQVESEINKGTTFTLSIPIIEVHETDQEEKWGEMPASEEVVAAMLKNTSNVKPQVLIVEDNTEMTNYLEEIFCSSFNVNSVSNGKLALRWLESSSAALIVSDVMMPEMDGFELLKRVQRNSKLKSIPFILLTARADRKDQAEGLRLGVDDYITKPFNREELLIRAVNLVHNLQNRIAFAKELEENSTDEVTNTRGVSSDDEKMAKSAQKYIESRISDTTLSIKEIAKSVSKSERQFYRKVSLITGMTPAQFIMEVRLQYAYKLLQSGQIVKLSQLTHEIGLSSDSYFSKLFYERFGKRPSSFMNTGY